VDQCVTLYCQREINFVLVAGADLRDSVMKTGRASPQHLVLLKKDWSARRAAESHLVTAGFRTGT